MKEVYNTQRKSEKDAFHSELKNLERIKKIKYKKTYTKMFFFCFFFLRKCCFVFVSLWSKARAYQHFRLKSLLSS